MEQINILKFDRSKSLVFLGRKGSKIENGNTRYFKYLPKVETDLKTVNKVPTKMVGKRVSEFFG